MNKYLYPPNIHMYACPVTQSRPTLCDPMTVTLQAPLYMEFSRQEHRSGLPFPSPGDLPNPGVKPKPPALAGMFFITMPQHSYGKP